MDNHVILGDDHVELDHTVNDEDRERMETMEMKRMGMGCTM